MVTSVIVDNKSAYTFTVRVRTRALDPAWPELPARMVDTPTSYLNPNERAAVAVVHRSKVPAHEKHEVLTDLVILDAAGQTTDVSVVLRQKVHGKLLGSSLRVSLSAQPYELLAPEQPWGKAHKLYEGHLSLQGGPLVIQYRFMPTTTGDGDVEYVLRQGVAKGAASASTSASASASASAAAAAAAAAGVVAAPGASAVTIDDVPGADVGMVLPSDLVLEEVWENQRGSGLSGPKGFSSRALFPGTERGQWSNIHGQHRLAKEYIDLPNSSWKWLWDWRVDKSGDVDEEGWQYAFSWLSSKWSGKCNGRMFVRRRRWIRMRRKITEEESSVADTARRRRAGVTLDEAATPDEIVQRLQDFHLMDAERAELIRAYLLARRGPALTPEQLVLAFDAFQFEIGRVEAVRSLCPELLQREQVQALLPMIKFFSYKRQLAAEFDLDIGRSQ